MWLELELSASAPFSRGALSIELLTVLWSLGFSSLERIPSSVVTSPDLPTDSIGWNTADTISEPAFMEESSDLFLPNTLYFNSILRFITTGSSCDASTNNHISTHSSNGKKIRGKKSFARYQTEVTEQAFFMIAIQAYFLSVNFILRVCFGGFFNENDNWFFDDVTPAVVVILTTT